MDQIERSLRAVVLAVSNLLDPVLGWLDRLHSILRHQLSLARVPVDLHAGIIAALWVVVLFILFRILSGWLRVVMLVCTAVVVAKVYGLLPG